MNPWVGNSSQISNLQMEFKYLDKLKCYRILSDSGGSTPWGGSRWVDRGGGGHGCVGGVPCMHTYAHAGMHACTCMLNMLNMDGSMSVAICNLYTCINVHVCMCVCVHACVWGHPPCPPPTCPPPQSCREPKTPKFNKS